MTFYADYKLSVGADGRVRGKGDIGRRINYNDPWPCPNGTPGGGASNMNGVVFHTMVGNLPGTISVFNDPAYQASSFFGIGGPWDGFDGTIHQFGPIGQDWMAWTQSAGNPNWYGIENADNGNPHNPLSSRMLTSMAALTEVLSAFADFPLQEANQIWERGLGVHYMGGEAWGGHSCPDYPIPGQPFARSSQRPEILRRAKLIRAHDKKELVLDEVSDKIYPCTFKTGGKA
jgi:N-acetylmuramoyl-L-alanine amidase